MFRAIYKIRPISLRGRANELGHGRNTNLVDSMISNQSLPIATEIISVAALAILIAALIIPIATLTILITAFVIFVEALPVLIATLSIPIAALIILVATNIPIFL